MPAQSSKKPMLGILTREEGWHFQDLCRAANTSFDVKRFDYGQLAAVVSATETAVTDQSREMNALDCLIVRAMPAGSLQQVVFRMDALLQLERLGVPIINPPKTIEASVDKYLSLSRLAAAGVPVPRTGTAQTVDAALRHFVWLGGDVVVKPLFGSQGLGLIRLNSISKARSCFEDLVEQEKIIYQQEFIAHRGWDLRLLVIGNRLLGMKRQNEHWITNISNGGTAIPWQPSAIEYDLAMRAAGAVDGGVVGVDLLYDTNEKPLVLEVNSCPGWQGISQCLDVDVAQMVVDFAASRARVASGAMTSD